MASQAAVHNFSLPSRSGSRRPFSPTPPYTVNGDQNRSCSRIDTMNMSAMDTALQCQYDGCVDDRVDGVDRIDGVDRVDRVQVRSPTPTAFQLFHFSDDAAPASSAEENRRSMRALPRPMSTSSSAPALGGIEHPASAVLAPHPEAADRPLSERLDRMPAPVPDRMSHDGGTASDNANATRRCSRTSHTPTATPRDTPPSPPPMARSISVRWGPRLRHISMSEVQAADDAARRIAAARRERLMFWLLVAVALVGVLSCTAAVTLAAAQAALQAGLEDVEGESTGLVWDARTLGWLIASLIVCASAAVGLVVATSARCRRSRKLHRWRSRTPTPPSTSTSPSQTGQSGQPAQTQTAGSTANARKTTSRLSALFASRREGGTKTGAWVEMEEMGAKRDSVAADTREPKWWRFGKATAQGTYGGVAPGSPKASTTKGGGGGGGDGAVDVPDEDRNWAKFSQDPVQLRRYVESLEARLTGGHDAPVDKQDKDKQGKEGRLDDSSGSPTAKRIRIRPSTSVRTIETGKTGKTGKTARTAKTAGTEMTTATATTIQPVMGRAGPLAPHSAYNSAYSLLLPPASPASVVSASVVSSSSPRRPQGGLSVGRDLTRPPLPAHTATLPASNTQGSILGQLYASYSERERD